jgi:hypothetical protein
LAVFDRIDEAEKTHPVIVAFKVRTVYLGRDATDAAPADVRAKDNPLAVLEKRIFAGVEAIFELDVERANVRGVATVDEVDDVQKVVDWTAHGDLPDDDHSEDPLADPAGPSKHHHRAAYFLIAA